MDLLRAEKLVRVKHITTSFTYLLPGVVSSKRNVRRAHLPVKFATITSVSSYNNGRCVLYSRNTRAPRFLRKFAVVFRVYFIFLDAVRGVLRNVLRTGLVLNIYEIKFNWKYCSNILLKIYFQFPLAVNTVCEVWHPIYIRHSSMSNTREKHFVNVAWSAVFKRTLRQNHNWYIKTIFNSVQGTDLAGLSIARVWPDP